MTDHTGSAGALHRIELSASESDAERLGRAKRAMRETDRAAALLVTGDFDGETTDAGAHAGLLNLLLEAPLPVLALVSGAIAPRGLSLLLTADRAVLGPEAAMTGNWRGSPSLAPLLHYRLGPLAARRVLFDPSRDPLDFLVEYGLAIRSAQPDADVQEIVNGIEGGLGPRLKRSLRASAELPLKEALAFDLWFSRSHHASAP